MHKRNLIKRVIAGAWMILAAGCNHDSLPISEEQAANHTVGGSAFGLLGTLALEINGSDILTLNADGGFTFSNALPSGSSYSIAVQSQPTTQTCTVSNGSGAITNANITNVAVNCSTNTRAIGGTAFGLDPSESVVLENDGGDNLILNSNGHFTFSTPVAQGALYNVTVVTQPVTQTCTVTGGSGTTNTSDVTDVQVTCSTNAYTIGGTVSGLSNTVVLQNNGADNLSISSNGPFSFATPVAEGAIYNVTVLTQPAAQTCTVINGSGTMGGANVTNVGVNCAVNTTTLSTSVDDLALSVTGLTDEINGASSGVARTITITNTGSYPAVNLSITPPAWPAGTTSSTTCGNTLAAGNSCAITVTPGSTATSDGTNPCSSGTAPIPGAVQVTADNANTVSTNVVVLAYGCVHQEGFIFAMDDTTSSSGSVGGTIASLANTSSGIQWNNGSYVVTNAQSLTDGATNSADAISVQGAGSYAAEACASYTIDASGNSPCSTGACYGSWHLPAICQLGASGEGAGCSSGTANMVTNLPTLISGCSGSACLSGFYWSSTEYSGDPQFFAWSENVSSGGSSQNLFVKAITFSARCSRALTP